MTESKIGTLRRFYLLKRLAAMERLEFSLAAVWQSKQEEQSSTVLPVDFPHRAALALYGYTAIEDLEFTDVDELVYYAKLTRRAAEEVIAAHAAL